MMIITFCVNLGCLKKVTHASSLFFALLSVTESLFLSLCPHVPPSITWSQDEPQAIIPDGEDTRMQTASPDHCQGGSARPEAMDGAMPGSQSFFLVHCTKLGHSLGRSRGWPIPVCTHPTETTFLPPLSWRESYAPASRTSCLQGLEGAGRR